MLEGKCSNCNQNDFLFECDDCEDLFCGNCLHNDFNNSLCEICLENEKMDRKAGKNIKEYWEIGGLNYE